MGQALRTLESLVGSLDSLDEDLTIYAREPWTAASDAIAAAEPAEGGLPTEAREEGLKYFLEVSVAKEFLEGWIENAESPTRAQQTERLIRYAIYDA